MNLLDEEILAEVIVVIPKVGAAQFFASKADSADQAYVLRVAQETINAACNFAAIHGFPISGQFGPQPPPAPAP